MSDFEKELLRLLRAYRHYKEMTGFMGWGRMSLYDFMQWLKSREN